MSELASIHNARYIGQADGEGAVIGQKKKIIKRMSVTKGINPYGPNIAKSIKQLLQKAKRVRQTGFELVSRSCPVGEWEDRILTTRPLARCYG